MAAIQQMDAVARAINKQRAVIFCSVLKHLSLDDERQHLVQLLAAHIQQFPHDSAACGWLPGTCWKLKKKAIALAQGIKAGEESDEQR